MRKAILKSIVISVGAGVIASVSYHAGKVVGACEFGIGLLKEINEARNKDGDSEK